MKLNASTADKYYHCLLLFIPSVNTMYPNDTGYHLWLISLKIMMATALSYIKIIWCINWKVNANWLAVSPLPRSLMPLWTVPSRWADVSSTASGCWIFFWRLMNHRLMWTLSTTGRSYKCWWVGAKLLATSIGCFMPCHLNQTHYLDYNFDVWSWYPQSIQNLRGIIIIDLDDQNNFTFQPHRVHLNDIAILFLHKHKLVICSWIYLVSIHGDEIINPLVASGTVG
jgi:hypothetical protein